MGVRTSGGTGCKQSACATRMGPIFRHDYSIRESQLVYKFERDPLFHDVIKGGHDETTLFSGAGGRSFS